MTRSLRALLVDDHWQANLKLSQMLEQHCPQIEVVATALDTREARHILMQQNIDVIFLDILMPGENGLDFLLSLPKFSFHVVFVSSCDTYALKALNANAAYYLLKPIEKEELVEVVEELLKLDTHLIRKRIDEKTSPDQLNRIAEHWKKPDVIDSIGVKHRDGIKVIPYSEIVFLEAFNSYTTIVTKSNAKFTLSKSIKTLEEMLESSHFFRAHKSYIVNTRLITDLRDNSTNLILMDKYSVNLARRRKRELKAILQQKLRYT